MAVIRPLYMDTADGAIKRSAPIDVITPVPGNLLMNGGFDIFQRTDPTVATARSDDTYGPDRWIILTQTASVNIARTTGDTLSLNALRITQNQASAQRFGILQIIEAVPAKARRSRTVIAHMRVKPSSGGTNGLRIALLEWTGTADSPTSEVVNSWTNTTFTAGQFFVSSNLTVAAVSAGGNLTGGAWNDIEITGTISASCTNLMVFAWVEGAVAQNETCDFTEATLYDGATTLPWLPVNPQQDITRLLRYYEKSYPLEVPPATASAFAGLEDFYTRRAIAASTSGGIAQGWLFLVTKRIIPAVTLYNPGSGASGSVRVGVNSRSGATAGQVGQRGCGNLQFDNTSAQAIALDDEIFFQWAADAEL